MKKDKSILIVEDEGILALHTKTILERYGYQVFEPVATGEKAIECLKNNQPAVILMDIELSGELSGIETAKIISEKYEVPLIFITGYSQDHLINQAKTAAPYGYLVKPIEERELIAMIEMTLYKHELDVKLKHSEARYRTLIEQASDGIVVLDANGKIIEANPAACAMFGYTCEEIKKQSLSHLISNEGQAKSHCFEKLKKNKKIRLECKTKTSNENEMPIEIHGKALDDGSYQILVRDITHLKEKEQKSLQNEQRLKTLVKIAQHEAKAVQAFLDYALDKAIKLTKSEIGYIYFYDDQNEEFILNSWSKKVMDDCKIVEPQTRYMLAATGLWGEAVRQRKAIVDNDYQAPGEFKKGYPDGHVALKKFLTIPVVIDEKIVAVVGVANKKEDYNEADELQLSLLMDSAWKKVQRIKIEKSLAESQKNFDAFFESVNEMIIVTDLGGEILFNNDTVVKNLGYAEEELRQMNALALHGQKQREAARKIYSEMLKGQRKHSTLSLQSKEGYEIPAETRIWLGTWNEKECVYVLSKDLSAEKEALERFERLFRNNPALMALSSVNDRKFVDVNESFEKVTGYSRDEVIGKTAQALGLFPDHQKQTEIGQELQRVGMIANKEMAIRTKDGRVLEGNFSGEIIYVQGEPYSLTVMIDITETKRYHVALEQKTLENKFLADAAQYLSTCTSFAEVNDYICENINKLIPDTPVVFANIDSKNNLKIVDILGLEKNFIGKILKKLGYDFQDKNYPLTEKFINLYSQQRLTNLTDDSQAFIGEEFPINIAKNVIKTLKIDDIFLIGIADKHKNYGVLQFYKTKDSKRLNKSLIESFVHQCYLAFARIDSFEKLKTSEEKVSQLVNNIDQIIWLRDKATKELLFVNPAYQRILDESQNDWLTDTDEFIQIIHADDRTRIQLAEQALFEKDQAFDEEYRIAKADGGYRWLRVKKYPILNEDDIVTRYAGIAEDITDRKELQKDIAVSEEKYHLLFTEMEEGFALHEIILDEKGQPIDYRFLDVNPKFETYTGLKAADCVGKTVLELLPETESYWIEKYGKVALTGQSIHYENYSRAFHKWFSVNAFSPQRGQFAVMMTDVSETKNAEQLLQFALDQNQAMLNAMPDMMFLFDREYVIKNFHAPDPAVLFEKPEKFLGKKADEVMPHFLAELTKTRVDAALKSGETQYTRYELHESGQINHFEARYAVSGENEVLAIVRDITQQKEAERKLEKSTEELKVAYEETLQGWSNALELREHETAGHSQRVVELSIQLAKNLGVQEAELMHFRRGALLHDIGKMGIPDSILLKPGPLTDDEWVIMRQHPVYAKNLLSKIPFLQPALEIPYCHHERWDGTGYPQKLKGEAIPLSARIFAIIDVWDALSNNRPYRPAWEKNSIIEHIKNQKGKHFDPAVVDAFLDLLEGFDHQSDLLIEKARLFS